MKLLRRIIVVFLIVIVWLVIVTIVYVRWGLAPKLPQVADSSAINLKREIIDSTCFKIKNCWL